ncbi:hypothetical protein [Mesorhizobium koreense]|jgi:hypothetical protein|uniref:hypothetical protein n=1 Tax=Mesorhizobium koreense TaxID=3074855 RepID=UPI00287B7B14|nr:hypothetical protein [Mesorhizobium sp. WR6]
MAEQESQQIAYASGRLHKKITDNASIGGSMPAHGRGVQKQPASRNPIEADDHFRGDHRANGLA